MARLWNGGKLNGLRPLSGKWTRTAGVHRTWSTGNGERKVSMKLEPKTFKVRRWRQELHTTL